jgi:hypothetical protein
LPINPQSRSESGLDALMDEQSGDSNANGSQKVIDRRQRQAFLDGLNRDFTALRSNTEPWEEESAERQSWNATLG